jgi:hypothetical protein
VGDNIRNNITNALDKGYSAWGCVYSQSNDAEKKVFRILSANEQNCKKRDTTHTR